MPTDTDLFASIPLFSPLDRRERLALAQGVEVVRMPAGRIVFAYGDRGDRSSCWGSISRRSSAGSSAAC